MSDFKGLLLQLATYITRLEIIVPTTGPIKDLENVAIAESSEQRWSEFRYANLHITASISIKCNPIYASKI
jgi:hypothetical protein